MAFVVRHSASFYGHVKLGQAAEATAGRVRVAVLRKAHRLPLSRIAATGSNRIASMLTHDTDALRAFLSDGVNKLTHATVFLVGGLALCFRTDAALTLGVAATAAGVAACGRVLAEWRRVASAKCAAAAGDASALAAESLAQPRLVKAFGAQRPVVDAQAAAEKHTLSVVTDALVSMHAASNVLECLGRLVLCGVISVGALRVQQGALTPGGLVTFSYNVFEVGGAVEKLVATAGSGYDALGRIARVLALLEAPEEFDDDALPVRGRKPISWEGVNAVEVLNCHFAYMPEADAFGAPAPEQEPQWILRGVTLTVAQGEVVSLCGPSGCGKSTLLDLLCRFFDTAGGAIRIGGVDVRELDHTELRASVGCVFQGAELVRGSVTENIRYGSPNATFGDVQSAAVAAGADEFIEKLQGGYQHMITREGGGLSGGQAARIAVARALLRKPRLLLLDEPTAALDGPAEAKLIESLLSRCRSEGIAVLMVHHRIAAARHADKIFVLRGGAVEQAGTHASLMKDRGGLYAQMALAQGVLTH